MTTSPTSVPTLPLARRGLALLLWPGLLLCVFGVVHYGLWAPWATDRSRELGWLALAACLAATPLRFFLRLPWAHGLAVFWGLALLLFAGAVPVLATLLLALAAVALGRWIAGRGPVALQCALGLAAVGGTLGWLLPLPVHYRWTYLALLALIVGLRWRPLREDLGRARAAFGEAVAGAPCAAAFAVLALGLAGTTCWLPTLQFDDVAYHLRLPWQLQDHGYYDLDPGTHLWALAPWIGDVVQAIPQLLAGAEARGAVDALWLVLAACGLWRLSALLDAAPAIRWLAVAVYASLPLTAVLGGGMQTELPTTAWLAWLLVLVLRPPVEAEAAAALRGAALLAGVLVALKLTAACFAALLMPLVAWRLRLWRPARLGGFVAIVVLVGGSSYLYAQLVAGNPLLPLFNAFFESPYLAPVDLKDERWYTGFNPALPWNLTFATSRYMEAADGGGGFALLGLAGAWALAWFRPKLRLPLAMATLLAAFALFSIQYLRYAYPPMVLMLPVLAAAAGAFAPRQAVWLLAGLSLMNLAFQSHGHWMLRNGVVRMAVEQRGKDRPLFERYTPERALIAAMRARPRGSGKVLAIEPEQPFTAELGADGLNVTWYAPERRKQAWAANDDPGGDAWIALFKEWQVGEVIVRRSSVVPAQEAALRRLGAVQRERIGGMEWWSLPGGEPPP